MLLLTVGYGAFATARVASADPIAGLLFAAVAAAAALALVLFAPKLPGLNDAPAWRRILALLALRASLSSTRALAFVVAGAGALALFWGLGEGSLRRVYVHCSGAFEVRTWPAGSRDFECSTRAVTYWHPFFFRTPRPVCLPDRVDATKDGPDWRCETDYRIVDFSDDLDFAGWQPVSPSRDSRVQRDIRIAVRRAPTTNAAFQTTFGTTAREITATLHSAGGSIDEEIPSSNPPRRIFHVTVGAESLPPLIDTIVSYSIFYKNNFPFPETDDIKELLACGTCDVSLRFPPYAVDRYSLRLHSLPAPFFFRRAKLAIVDAYGQQTLRDVTPASDGASVDYLATKLGGGTRLSLYISVGRRP